MKELEQFIEPISDFTLKSAPFMVEAFAWFLHEVKDKEKFSTADLGLCFDAVHVQRPANIAAVLAKLVAKRPARIIRDNSGFRLSADARKAVGALLPVRAASVKTNKDLGELLGKVTGSVQQTFLNETLLCFKHHAYRSAVVMAWNLAFSDVLDRIFRNHLPAFNAQLAKVVAKSAPIAKRSDFEDLKESKVIEVGRGAAIFSSSTSKILTEKLNKRNTCAHPSMVIVSAVTAEEVISDLVQNIILRPVW